MIAALMGLGFLTDNYMWKGVLVEEIGTRTSR